MAVGVVARLGDPLANCAFSGKRLHDQDGDQQQVSHKAECQGSPNGFGSYGDGVHLRKSVTKVGNTAWEFLPRLRTASLSHPFLKVLASLAVVIGHRDNYVDLFSSKIEKSRRPVAPGCFSRKLLANIG